MAKRKKKRTHVKADEEAFEKIPKSFVIKSGVVGKSVSTLVTDLRKAMEPNTATNLRERKGNKLKDFVHVASQLSVTHLLVLSKTPSGINLRVGRIPRGPTLTFRISSYSLTRDVLALQTRPKSPGTEFKTAPLVVLNNFNSDERHIKLVATVFQNLFPPIQVQTMKLADARRVILFNLNPETKEVEFRHYSITVKVTGVSKSVKHIIQTDIPDLNPYTDVSEYILREAYASESDIEDGPESTVTLSQKYIGKGNRQSEQRSIRLVELGPRIQMSLTKIQAGLCGGEVLYHSFVKKTAEEVKQQKQQLQKAAQEKAKRKAEQEKNVEKKKVEAEEKSAADRAAGKAAADKKRGKGTSAGEEGEEEGEEGSDEEMADADDEDEEGEDDAMVEDENEDEDGEEDEMEEDDDDGEGQEDEDEDEDDE
ncbi:hypothetical protein HK097_000046 [Rhizophlyctis rosea]|uniref:Brix domain-containing protein n=1 Tax=Rhizophlyctis rosea TaxID=64517 RepID=A0AAD5SLH0_9FUNG|nr:hypothetical protein HK097_000046 [Rhizophlyctis rosea]